MLSTREMSCKAKKKNVIFKTKGIKTVYTLFYCDTRNLMKEEIFTWYQNIIFVFYDEKKK